MKRGKNLLLLLFFALYLWPGSAYSQTNDSIQHSFSLGARINYSYIFIHAKDHLPNDDYFPRGGELNFNWHRLDQKAWDQCNCYPKSGLILSFYNLDSKVLGYAISTMWYVEPVFSSYRKWSYSVRGAAGLSLQTNPYDPFENPNNQAYSLPVAAFVLLNFGVSRKMNDRLSWNLAFNINHTSNGGIKDPNKGLNFPSFSFGADYTFKPVTFIKREKKSYKKEKAKLHKEASIFYSSRSISHGEKKRFGIYGASVLVSKQVGRVSAINAGGEFYFDYALKEKLARKNLEGDFKRAGLLFGHEFLIGKFSFTQHLGFYVYNNTAHSDWYFKYNDRLYQRYGLKYLFGKMFVLGVDLKVDRYIANFVDVRAGVFF